LVVSCEEGIDQRLDLWVTRIPWACPWLQISATLLLVLISPRPTLLVLVAMLICASLALALVAATLRLSAVPKAWCSSLLFILAGGGWWFHGVFPFDRECWVHDQFGKHYLVQDKVQERSRAILPSDAWNEILAEFNSAEKEMPITYIAQMMQWHTFTVNTSWIVCMLLLANICFTSISFE
jgi:hypothetical protein